MTIPLPDPLRDLVAKSESLSLRFDRGYDGYDETKNWKHRQAGAGKQGKEGKTQFLETFVEAFKGNAQAKELYEQVLARRVKALEPLAPVQHTGTSALIVGIGRWNPVEVGFTFDRFTGSPFLPGSSVKGLLRAAAELVGKGELDGDRAFWSAAAVGRVFGKQELHGAFVFYDACPAHWPALEVDVMTPHHSKYYDGTLKIAADWDEPVPVHFLRVKAGTRFLFWFGPRSHQPKNAEDRAQIEADRAAIETLLTIALDWLGVGAKTSSGYGWFETPAAPPPPPPEEIVVWENALLEWLPQTGSIKITYGSQRTETKDPQILNALPVEVWTRLRKHKKVTARVRVKRDHNLFKVTGIEPD
jgi:CRISPR type III-B/RAMP module RAMP protein Cmr6